MPVIIDSIGEIYSKWNTNKKSKITHRWYLSHISPAPIRDSLGYQIHLSPDLPPLQTPASIDSLPYTAILWARLGSYLTGLSTLLYAGAHLGAYYYRPVHTWGFITIWMLTFGIQEYTTWNKGNM